MVASWFRFVLIRSGFTRADVGLDAVRVIRPCGRGEMGACAGFKRRAPWHHPRIIRARSSGPVDTSWSGHPSSLASVVGAPVAAVSKLLSRGVVFVLGCGGWGGVGVRTTAQGFARTTTRTHSQHRARGRLRVRSPRNTCQPTHPRNIHVHACAPTIHAQTRTPARAYTRTCAHTGTRTRTHTARSA